MVPNGIDTERFRPDAAARSNLRHELGFDQEHIAIGLIARLDPMKDHPTFLQAAAILAKRHPKVRFVCVGVGTDNYESELKRLAHTLGLADRLIWLGSRNDVAKLLNAFDIVTLSSAYGEGFPNVVGEAMATGLPCVVTDVGDAARIVGDAGFVVSRGDPEALANALSGIVAAAGQRRQEIGVLARARIEGRFPERAMISRSAELIYEVSTGGHVSG